MTPPSKPKVWFITGASRGLGTHIAKAALTRGDKVVGTARNPLILSKSLTDHPNFFGIALDVVYEGDTHQAAKAAAGRFGRIDVLVNNAGYGLVGAVEETDHEEVQAIYDANVFGLLHVTRSVLPYMRRQKAGHIINMSSVGALSAYPGWGIYCSTKYAVEGITEALAAELKPLGIHATTVEAGYFQTDFHTPQSLISAQRHLPDYETMLAATRAFVASPNHLAPGDPVKLAHVILKLADAENPPVHLPLGADAVAKLREKIATVQRELDTWLDLATHTDRDDFRGPSDPAQLTP